MVSVYQFVIKSLIIPFLQAVNIAKLDCTASQSICQENDVKGYPTLAYFRNGKKIETYRGAR